MPPATHNFPFQATELHAVFKAFVPLDEGVQLIPS